MENFIENYFQAITEIIMTGHWITDQVTRELKEFDITEQQYNVLRVLADKKGCPVTVLEIQGKMVQKSSNVTRLIDKLISKGLVIRNTCPENRRKVDITITQSGLELLVVLEKKVIQFHQPLQKNLTADECITIAKLIKKLRR
jgi:MarR family transcriptional regulator, 2-MHQ and catechol-resistance regulon repressor